jgi:hypothetical protein
LNPISYDYGLGRSALERHRVAIRSVRGDRPAAAEPIGARRKVVERATSEAKASGRKVRIGRSNAPLLDLVAGGRLSWPSIRDPDVTFLENRRLLSLASFGVVAPRGR